MKTLALVLALISSQVYSHGHGHRHVDGTIESVAGWSSLAWNTAELAMHSIELAGFKPVCRHGCHHAHGSFIEKAYNAIELATHGLNLFETTAKLSESISGIVDHYIPATLTSSSAVAFNVGVILYRIVDSKKQFEIIASDPGRLAAYGFQIWSLIDLLGHASSIYMAALGNEET